MTTLSNGHAPDSVYEKVRAHFREDEIVALTLSIAMINAWNRLKWLSVQKPEVTGRVRRQTALVAAL